MKEPFLFLTADQKARAETLFASAPHLQIGAVEVTEATGAYAIYNSLWAVALGGMLQSTAKTVTQIRTALDLSPELLDAGTPDIGTATFHSAALNGDDTAPYAIVPLMDLPLLLPQPEPEVAPDGL